MEHFWSKAFLGWIFKETDCWPAVLLNGSIDLGMISSRASLQVFLETFEWKSDISGFKTTRQLSGNRRHNTETLVDLNPFYEDETTRVPVNSSV